MNVKVEFALPEYRLLDTGDEWHGHPIVFSTPPYEDENGVEQPGSPHALVKLPESWSETIVRAYMDRMVREGELVNWRPAYEDDYKLLGFADWWTDTHALGVGDTFGLHGLTKEVIDRGKGGQGVTIGICDTGVDSRHSHFAAIDVRGRRKGWDSHGHGTHCAGTAGGRFGIATKAAIYAGLALPSGGTVPRVMSRAQFLPGGASPMLPVRGDDWRGYLGGVLIHIWVPALDGSGMTGARVAAIFADPAAARSCWQCERTMKRGTAYFRFNDGHWYIYARYRSKEPPKPKRRPRWQVAPQDWPRDKWGAPKRRAQRPSTTTTSSGMDAQ